MKAPATRRMTASPCTLLREAAGGWRGFGPKLGRLTRALARYADHATLDARLARLASRGLISAIPSRVQLVVGAVEMLRWWIAPAAADYYRSRGIDFGFHQTLRWLEEPASMVDPLGLLSTRDNLIGHVMQVVHANPVYDLQLLEAHEDGLEQLEAQLIEMIDGRHPRAKGIAAIVEEEDYHENLLRFVHRYREDRDPTPLLRSNIQTDPRWRELERTFGSLSSAMAYFEGLPRQIGPAVVQIFSTSGFASRGHERLDSRSRLP